MKILLLTLSLLLCSPLYGDTNSPEFKAYQARLKARKVSALQVRARMNSSKVHVYGLTRGYPQRGRKVLPPSRNGHTMGWRGRRCGVPEPPRRTYGSR
jgi:hypothetical protein